MLYTVRAGAAAGLVPAQEASEGSHPLAEDANLAARACALIGDLHAQVGRVPVADVLKALLDATAYRAALLRAGDPIAGRRYNVSSCPKSDPERLTTAIPYGACKVLLFIVVFRSR